MRPHLLPLVGLVPWAVYVVWLHWAGTQPAVSAPLPAPYDWATEPRAGTIEADADWDLMSWDNRGAADAHPVWLPTTYTCHTAHIDQAAE